jgi:thymidylate kinase
MDLFDGVFILDVDLDTLKRRLDERTENEWGGKPTERELIARLHQTKEDIPKNGILIDATAPIAHVVDEIVRQSEANK